MKQISIESIILLISNYIYLLYYVPFLNGKNVINRMLVLIVKITI